MKLHKTLAALVVASLFTAGIAFAEDAKKDAPEAKAAACCAKAAKAGDKCGHACCIEAASAGKNCEKCGGAGMAKTT